MSQPSRIGIVMASLVAVGALATGCSVVGKVKQAVHTVEGNKATIDSFNQNLQSTKDTPFEATYTTTGSSPATVVYAVDPSQRRPCLPRDPDGIERVHHPGDRERLGRVRVQPEWIGWRVVMPEVGPGRCHHENKIFDVYTPSHWVSFLKGVSLVAGLAGDKVTTSTMSLNGFDMNCVDLVAKRRAGHQHHLQTSQGILGYVEVASESTSFQITNYSSSPDPSLFQLPPGATVTTPTTATT